MAASSMAAELVPSFDGNDSYVLIGTPGVLQIPSNDPFTIEGWMAFESLSTRDMLYCKNNAKSGPAYTYLFGFADDALAAYDGAAWQGSFAATRVTNQWYHLAFSFDGTTLSYYLDGALLGATAFSFINTEDHTIKLGGYSGATGDIDGTKSDVRVWDHARDQTAILADMNRRLAGSEAGLIAYWPLNDGAGTTAGDATGNGSDGGIINATWAWVENFDLAPYGKDFLLAIPFVLANIETGSTEFTNSNEVDVIEFQVPGGYDRYQVTESGETSAINPGGWIATNIAPGRQGFALPATDTNVMLYAWFTNASDAVTLRRASDGIRYTTALPVPAVRANHARQQVDGQPVVISPIEIDNGSTGGVSGGETIPIHSMSLTWRSGPDPDATPDAPEVTVSSLGSYTVELVVMNAAGNVATSTVCDVEITEYDGDDLVWTGIFDSDWHQPLNWDLVVVPFAGVDTIIGGGASVLLTNATATLGSLTLGGTLTFSNWTTRLTADQVTIQSGGIMRHTLCITNQVPSNTNRIHLVCTDLTVEAGGSINAVARGYPGPAAAPANTQYYGTGPGRGYGSGGGGHGGRGARGGYGGANEGPAYGHAEAPDQPGSGGGGHNGQLGGAGGGAVRIEATGTVTVNGTITVNGGGRSGQAGAGSGGSVWIDCAVFQGHGTISARGGDGGGHSTFGHAGGGGRIAIYYQDDIDIFTAPVMTVTAAAGADSHYTLPPEDGTVVFNYTGADVLLTVTGVPAAYGVSTPYLYGFRPYPAGTVITNHVDQHVSAGPGIRRWCTGWTAATNEIVYAEGTTTQAVFTLPSEDTLFTWTWTNQYYLDLSAGPGGSISLGQSGWYTNGLAFYIVASATHPFTFLRWNGDIPTEDREVNPLRIVMDRPRTIQATFVDPTPVTRTWNGGGYVWEPEKWTPAGIPGPNDTLIIASGTMTNDAVLRAARLTIQAGATVFVNGWDSTLDMTGDVDVFGIVTHALCDTNTAPDNISRVHVVCENLTLHAGGRINVNSKGFRRLQGPGAPAGSDHGGGYGGRGGLYHWGNQSYVNAGQVYGDPTFPELPGSGGGDTSHGNGGGAVWIEAADRITINGSITANSLTTVPPQFLYHGGGSGGGITLICRRITGTNGLITADGGYSWDTWGYQRGGGGGGRIAIHYDPAAQSNQNLTARPHLRIWANHGFDQRRDRQPDPGTIWVTDHQVLPDLIRGGTWHGVDHWQTDHLIVSNGWATFPDGMSVTVQHDLIVTNSGRCFLSGRTHATRYEGRFFLNRLPTVDVGGDLIVRPRCDLTVTSAMTNDVATDWGTTVTVDGTLTVQSLGNLFTVSQPITGCSPYFQARHIVIQSNGTVNADLSGFAGGSAADGDGPGGGLMGPTTGSSGGGGGFGGHGGQYQARGMGGPAYGLRRTPLFAGSGGGGRAGLATAGGRGGGLVRMHAHDTLTVHGLVTADGANAPVATVGGGSGGGIYLTCRVLGGTGHLRANGGNAGTTSGAGGGGRVATWRLYSLPGLAMTASADAGSGTDQNGLEPGTIYWGVHHGAMMRIR